MDMTGPRDGPEAVHGVDPKTFALDVSATEKLRAEMGAGKT